MEASHGSQHSLKLHQSESFKQPRPSANLGIFEPSNFKYYQQNVHTETLTAPLQWTWNSCSREIP